MASSCSTVEHMHRVAFYRVGTKIIESIWSTPLQPQLLITFLAHPTVIFPASNVRTTTGRVLTHELHQIRRTVLLVIRRRWPFRFKIRSIIFFCFSFLLLFFFTYSFQPVPYSVCFHFLYRGSTESSGDRDIAIFQVQWRIEARCGHARIAEDGSTWETSGQARVCTIPRLYLLRVVSALSSCLLRFWGLDRYRDYELTPALPMRLRVSLLQVQSLPFKSLGNAKARNASVVPHITSVT